MGKLDTIVGILIVIGIIHFPFLLVGTIYYFKPQPAAMPTFVLGDVTMYEFDAASASSGPPGPSYLNTTMQVTLSSRNPNDHVGIYYYTLSACASYRSQLIAPLTIMEPQAYQGHKEVIKWSPFLEGRMIPVSPGALAQDLTAGKVPIDVKIDGHVKWEKDPWIYSLHVKCPALLMLNTPGAATGSGSGLSMKVQPAQHCTAFAVRGKQI